MDVDDPMGQALAAHVRAEVAAAGWSKAEAAERFGIDYSTYRRYFVVMERSPDFSALVRIAHALGTTPAGFMRDVEDRARRTHPNPPAEGL